MPHIDVSDFRQIKSKKFYMYEDYVKLVRKIKENVEEDIKEISLNLLDSSFVIDDETCNRLKFLNQLRIADLEISLVFPNEGIHTYNSININEVELFHVNMFVKITNITEKTYFNDHEGTRYILHRKVFMSRNEHAKEKLAS